MPPKSTKPKPAPPTAKPEPTNPAPKPLPTDLPIHTFPTAASFSSFLSENHKTLPGLHLKLAKKSSGIASISAPEAVEVALCHGWIDGRANALDEKYWLVRYTPRRSKSMWSAKNVATVGRLIEEGRMTDAGMEAVEAAKRDGRWERAYDGPAGISVPGDLREALEGDERAKRAFEALGRGDWYRVLHRLQTGAAARRKERIEGVVRMLAGGEVEGRRATAKVTAKAKAKVSSSGSSQSFRIEKKTLLREGRKDGKRGVAKVKKRVERVDGEASLSGAVSRQLRPRNRVK
ncbi:YdeI/OmpD-associated family protein [Aspergillus mulundensis]|uniref:Uncharacterized protein n=1 Tax=Aspergillus mulundensis TaxID=1810919 RepID=A0A3D8R8Y7_9EURO|nr:Uncharacterized protein DSM5745_08028 [Aspergillus mulundensis]RDW70517.1 Uncharacterized protein DSM5745_08028 [Aspergillus mulundensis]